MDSAARRAAADANLVAAFDIVRLHNAGRRAARRAFGDAIAIASGHPAGYFNPVFALEPSTAASDVLAAVDWMAALELPASVHLANDTDPAIPAALVAGGLQREADVETVMVVDPIPPPDSAADGARVRAGGVELVDEWHRALEAGTILRAILNRELVADPRVRISVADVDGEPVAGAMVVRSDDTLGVYSVATVESARRRGLGRAVTWAAIDAGHRAWGSSIAVLQSSRMAVSLYAAMGFQTIGTITVFETPPGTARADPA
jgi:ribosomal protein S18 acetylase RimI-like enzyme